MFFFLRPFEIRRVDIKLTMAEEFVAEYKFDPLGVFQSTRLQSGDLIDLTEHSAQEANSESSGSVVNESPIRRVPCLPGAGVEDIPVVQGPALNTTAADERWRALGVSEVTHRIASPRRHLGEQGELEREMVMLRAEVSRMEAQMRRQEDLANQLSTELSNRDATIRELREQLPRGRDRERQAERLQTSDEIQEIQDKRFARLIAEEKQKVTQEQNNLKARDIGKLLMTDCSGATSKNRLRRFFRQIEDCEPKSANRPKVAYSRMEESVQAAVDKVWTAGMSWPDFQRVIHEKYDGRVDEQTVIQNLRREF